MKKHSLLIFLLPALIACGDDQRMQTLNSQNEALQEQVATLQAQVKKLGTSEQHLNFLTQKMQGIRARVVTNLGNIELKLTPELAPLHCFNFITRAESGYYNNTQFHRIMPGFMIQGGDPNSRGKDIASYGAGAPIAMIPHEFNDTPHTAGVLSMARSPDISQGAGSQFFIMHGTAQNLDRQYTAFGKVTSGMEVVDKIARSKTGRGGQQTLPATPVVIRKIEVYR